MDKAALARRIADVAVLRGEFTLRSGRKSNYYIDKYRFETQPDVLKALGELIAPHAEGVARLAAPELGAVPLAAAASFVCGKPMLFIRNKKKDYGSAQQIEGVYTAGESVLLIEDIITSGGQVLEAAKTLAEVGLSVKKVVVIIDRQEGAAEAIRGMGLELVSLFKTEDLGISV